MLRFGPAVAAVLACLAAAPALADSNTRTPRIGERQAHQERRIQEGIRAGEITRREAARLEHGQARIRRMEDRARADGVVTPAERHRLGHALDVQSRHIHRQRHDGQQRHRHDAWGGHDRGGRERTPQADGHDRHRFDGRHDHPRFERRPEHRFGSHRGFGDGRG